jgi:von Willebrand factor type A domain/Aerotolerance regulator N-terminal
MNFAVPTALAWAALALPLVALYILKVRLRRAPVSTTLFWRQIFDEKKPRSIWQRLRHLISLLVQILLLLLLVFALAEPFFPWEVLQARRLILIVDNSASMLATDAAPTRLAVARDIGFGIISRLRTRDEMALLCAGAPPRVVCGLTGHQRTLRQALQAVAPTGGPTRMAEAVELARRLIGDHPRGQIVLLSDGCFRDSESLLAAEDVSLQRVGERTANVGITQFQVRRSLVAPLGYEILVEVSNASDNEAECRLELDLDERPVDVVPLKLAPEQRWRQTFEKTSAEGGRLTGRLKHADALSLDNEAVAILAPPQRQRVLLVTAGNRFLQQALQANACVDLTVASAAPEQLEADTVVVFHRQTPQTLPAGNVLVVDPANATELWELGQPLVNPLVTEQARDSPLMRHVRLDNVLMPQARQLRMTAKAQVLAGALSGDPLYCACESPRGKVLVLTVNLDEGDLTFRTAFPILVTNALTWFAGRGAELQEA